MTFFYDLNKRLASLAEKQNLAEHAVPATQPAKKSPLAQALNERDLGKHNNATTGFAALAKKTGGGEKGARIAGAQLAKMRAKGQVEESDMDESAFQAAIGKKKYGDQGMKALQKAGREHASAKTMSNIRNKYDKYDESQGMADEGNAFTGKLASTPKGGSFKLGDKTFKDTSSLEEGICPTCDCRPCSCNEGNAFSGAVAKAKADGIQKGETIKVGGKTYPVKEADMVGLAEKKKAKPDFPDIDGDGNRKETMKKAASDKKRSTGTAFDKDHMDKLRKEKEAETHSRYDVHDTGYSKRYTRKAVDTDIDKDDEVKSDEPKKKGRPKGPAKGPERTTKGAWKHKGDRKVKEEETDEGWRGGMLGEPSVVKTGKKDPNAKVEAWNGLMAIVARGEGMEPAVLKHLKQIARTLKPEELELDEEKVEAGKREFFDRLAPAAKKAARVIGAISKSRTAVEEEGLETHSTSALKAASGKDRKTDQKSGVPAQFSTAQLKAELAKRSKVDEESTDKEDNKAEKAGKKVAKDIEYDEGHKGKDDNKAEKAGKKVTKDIEYDDKKDKEEKVDETADAPKASKGMQFGKGVYESINREVEALVESMNVSVNMSTDENGEPHKSITVSADGAEADVLAQLLKAAGIDHQGSESCSTCGATPCGCDQQVDENSPDWPTNTETLAADPNLRTYSGGLNGPKSTGQTTVPVVASQLRRQSTMEENVELERSLFKTWKNYKG